MTVGRITQTALESIVEGSPKGVVTQTGLEVIVEGSPSGVVTQTAVEVLIGAFLGTIIDLNEGSLIYTTSPVDIRDGKVNLNEGSHSYAGETLQILIPTNINTGSMSYSGAGVEISFDRSRLRNFFFHLNR